MTTAETISSAVQCASSLKGVVSYACAEGYAAENREAIAAGRIQGVEFPAPKKRKKPVRLNDKEKVAVIKQINAKRGGGMKKREAVEECGISVISYEKWTVKFGINYADKVVDKYPHDKAIAKLVREGDTVEDACYAFGVTSGSWRARAAKKGLYETNNKAKPREYYAARVAEVKEIVRRTGCTISAACKATGFEEHNYSRFKRLAD